MTNKEINVAIAEHLGWQRYADAADGGECWHKTHEGYRKNPPNYAGDLNACAQFEESLVRTDKRTLYLDHLYAIVCGDRAQKWEREWFTVAAKAHQRCEAFLRAIGKWRDA